VDEELRLSHDTRVSSRARSGPTLDTDPGTPLAPIISGWVLATTVVAGAGRVLNRS
jgi:hypothetical protein